MKIIGFLIGIKKNKNSINKQIFWYDFTGNSSIISRFFCFKGS